MSRLADLLRATSALQIPDLIRPDPYVVIPHAKVGMDGGALVEVWDTLRNQPVDDVYEATPEWVVCFVRDPETGGHQHVDKRPVLAKREGRFEIRKYLGEG